MGRMQPRTYGEHLAQGRSKPQCVNSTPGSPCWPLNGGRTEPLRGPGRTRPPGGEKPSRTIPHPPPLREGAVVVVVVEVVVVVVVVIVILVVVVVVIVIVIVVVVVIVVVGQ